MPSSFQQEEDKDKDKEFILQEERPKCTVNEFNKLIVKKKINKHKQEIISKTF